MKIFPLLKLLIIPAGNPLKTAPVAPIAVYVIFAMVEFIHTCCVSLPTAELKLIVLFGLT